MAKVFDSSAVLAVFYDESGAEKVRPDLPYGIISAVNAAEVITVLMRKGVPLHEAVMALRKTLLQGAGFFRGERREDSQPVIPTDTRSWHILRGPGLYGYCATARTAGRDGGPQLDWPRYFRTKDRADPELSRLFGELRNRCHHFRISGNQVARSNLKKARRRRKRTSPPQRSFRTVRRPAPLGDRSGRSRCRWP